MLNLAFLSRAVGCHSPSQRTSSGGFSELGRTHLCEKILCFSNITVDLPSLGGRWPDTTSNGGGEGLALEARSLQEVKPCRLGTQGMGECSEAPPTIQAEM